MSNQEAVASTVNFSVVIPARFASTRLPGKPLLDIAGKPMVQHVYERALQSSAKQVIIATDDPRIAEVARGFGAEVCMTHSHHPSGTDRLQEVAIHYGFADDHIVVNVQGDEPLIPPALINQVANNLFHTQQASAATLSVPLLDAAELFDPNTVKVLTDLKGSALYFSRAPIPWYRDGFAKTPREVTLTSIYQRHIGIYAYRVRLLHHFVACGVSPLEQAESLEQLRLMWHGHRIHVDTAMETPFRGIDTEEDLLVVRALLEKTCIVERA